MSGAAGHGTGRAAGWSARTFWVSLALLSTLVAAWGLATPKFAVPDEPAHFLKASAVARGQLAGLPGLPTAVTLPRSLESTRFQGGCFVFKPEVPADCAPGFDGGPNPDVTVYTTAGRYPPAYYAVVGLPTLLWTDLEVLYAVRGLSAALCAALLAAAFTVAAGTGRRLLTVAVGLAVTPTAVFLCSGVNPSGPEIAAAVALWTAGVALVLSDAPPRGPALVTAGLAAVVLALTRPVSPLWVALIGLAVLLLAGRRRVVAWARLRAVRGWSATVVLAAAAQTAAVAALGTVLYGSGQPLSISQRVTGSVARTDDRWQQMVAVFGWLDTPAPAAVPLAWGACLLALVVVGLRAAARARLAVLALVLVLVVVAPLALEVRSADEVGFFWQGRYTLPLAVGLPLLVAAAARREPRAPAPVLAVVAGVVAACHVVGFVSALGRYTVGRGNGLGLTDVAWQPPLPPLLLAGAVLVAAVAWALWLLAVPVHARPAAEQQAVPA